MFRTSALLSTLVSLELLAQSIVHTPTPPIIDGMNKEPQWQSAKWKDFNTVIIGDAIAPEDFSARYRMLWDKNAIYIQLSIQDDVLFDNNANPLEGYWSDDCLEIFVDEDASGGDHQFNHNAFAYHVALDNQVVDINTSKQPALYNDHVESQWQRDNTAPYNVTWEVAVKVYDDSFQDDQPAKSVALHEGKKIGLMLAYCDNDGSPIREHFIGSKDIVPVNGDKNRGWIDASVFDTFSLVK